MLHDSAYHMVPNKLMFIIGAYSRVIVVDDIQGYVVESPSQVRHHFAGEALDLLHPLGPAGDHELEGEVVDADLAVDIEGLEELLGIAAQLALVLGNRGTRHLDWAAAG